MRIQKYENCHPFNNKHIYLLYVKSENIANKFAVLP